ncbi:MAG: endonuclease domain-containing protein [Chloroflexota bacterium]|nr:endonuclease domain-containing protein [Chloroflexota bacterium]
MADTKARALRRDPTDAERKLWACLRLRQVNGHKFRRQRPIGPYIVDFVCLEARLVIKVDGSQHMEQASRDAHRDGYLISPGFTVLRFWDHHVLNETDAVLGVIAQVLEKPGGPPS